MPMLKVKHTASFSKNRYKCKLRKLPKQVVQKTLEKKVYFSINLSRHSLSFFSPLLSLLVSQNFISFDTPSPLLNLLATVQHKILLGKRGRKKNTKHLPAHFVFWVRCLAKTTKTSLFELPRCSCLPCQIQTSYISYMRMHGSSHKKKAIAECFDLKKKDMQVPEKIFGSLVCTYQPSLLFS